MKFSLKTLAAGAALALGALSAQATLYDISYTAVFDTIHDSGSGAFTMTAQVEGVLQGDSNTVLVSDIVSWTINGDTFTSSSFTGGGVGTLENYLDHGTFDGAAVFTLDGSLISLVAANATTENYIEFGTNNPYVTYADFAYMVSGHEYGFTYGPSDPLNGTWSMTPVTAVPEPASALLMLAAAPLLVAARRRKAASQAA